MINEVRETFQHRPSGGARSIFPLSEHEESHQCILSALSVFSSLSFRIPACHACWQEPATIFFFLVPQPQSKHSLVALPSLHLFLRAEEVS